MSGSTRQSRPTKGLLVKQQLVRPCGKTRSIAGPHRASCHNHGRPMRTAVRSDAPPSPGWSEPRPEPKPTGGEQRVTN
eukprot:8873977-Pyramimonas_sp.AAC.2